MSLFLPNKRESQIADGLSQAVRDRTLALHVQPIVALETGVVSGWESLLRYTHTTLGPVPPVEFIPIAERTGSIVDIGSWAVDTACRWRSVVGGSCVVGVNISARQLMDRRFAKMVIRTLERHELAGRVLCLELTETAVIDDIAAAVRILEQLRERQIDVALDDFGTGFASLAVLRSLPVNIVKIDRSYVATAGAGGREAAFLAGIISLCERMGAHVVAEGIERAEQLAAVRAMGATWGQGYLLGVPRPADPQVTQESAVDLAAPGQPMQPSAA